MSRKARAGRVWETAVMRKGQDREGSPSMDSRPGAAE